MKLIKTLRTLLIIQILAYAWTIYLVYDTESNPVIGDNFGSEMGYVVPLLIFMLLGVVNIILLIVYLVLVARRKINPEIFILGLAVIAVCLAVLYRPIDNWIDLHVSPEFKTTSSKTITST